VTTLRMTSRGGRACVAGVALLSCAATQALAGESADDAATHTDQAPSRSPAAESASSGRFLAFALPAASGSQRAFALGLAGFDGARRTGSFEAAAEVTPWGPVSIRGAAVYASGDGRVRPSIGVRIQLLGERRQGVDAAVGISYRPEGLTEAEGEIESAISVGRHWGEVYLLGNLLYGQDPDGKERDGEVRVAALRSIGQRWLLGVDGRARFDLGSDAAATLQHREATFDALVGSVAGVTAGPVALSLQTGGSAFRLQQKTSLGGFIMMGLGTTFR